MKARKLCRGCGVIKSRIAKLEERYRVHPSGDMVITADVKGWWEKVPRCLTALPVASHMCNACSDVQTRFFQGFIDLLKQSPQTAGA